ncbi:hypothetical protein [Frondihabitans cladoniiphilus]|uniref:Transcriptional regulator with AbiEi antitoxin domain of type IV toxin-antitoxin system n=1 Tax=Frondihabitans cladoniiphilus TaxID=715785 RepID=A0ABP8VPZ0_9MICO
MDLDRGITLIELLGEDGGFTIDLRSVDLALVDDAGVRQLYEIKVRSTAPAPSVLARDVESLDKADGDSRLLYVVPHLTKSLRATALRDSRIAVAATGNETVILDGTEWHALRAAPPPPAPRGRKPWGRLALMRALVRTDEPRTQAVLASETGVAQQAVALALPKLASLGVERGPSGWQALEPSVLWNAFLADYPGPGGLRRRWSGAAPLGVQVDRADELARASETSILLSGDLAADGQAPMRRPVSATVFATADIDLSARSVLVEDGEETLSVVVPADRTVFVTARAWHGSDSKPVGPELTDPMITAWEVAHSRGADRDDAVAHLKETVLAERNRRASRVAL